MGVQSVAETGAAPAPALGRFVRGADIGGAVQGAKGGKPGIGAQVLVLRPVTRAQFLHPKRIY